MSRCDLLIKYKKKEGKDVAGRGDCYLISEAPELQPAEIKGPAHDVACRVPIVQAKRSEVVRRFFFVFTPTGGWGDYPTSRVAELLIPGGKHEVLRTRLTQ